MSTNGEQELKEVAAFLGKVGLVAGTVALAVGALPIPHGAHFAKEAAKETERLCARLDSWSRKK